MYSIEFVTRLTSERRGSRPSRARPRIIPRREEGMKRATIGRKKNDVRENTRSVSGEFATKMADVDLAKSPETGRSRRRQRTIRDARHARASMSRTMFTHRLRDSSARSRSPHYESLVAPRARQKCWINGRFYGPPAAENSGGELRGGSSIGRVAPSNVNRTNLEERKRVSADKYSSKEFCFFFLKIIHKKIRHTKY